MNRHNYRRGASLANVPDKTPTRSGGVSVVAFDDSAELAFASDGPVGLGHKGCAQDVVAYSKRPDVGVAQLRRPQRFGMIQHPAVLQTVRENVLSRTVSMR